MKTNKKSISPVAIVLCVVLVIYSIALLLLIYWALITSLKTNLDYGDGDVKNNFLGLPRFFGTERGDILAPWQWAWGNFAEVFKFFKIPVNREGWPKGTLITFPMQAMYTVIYSVGCAFFATLCPCIVAYATQKFKYGFNKVIDAIVIICMTVPIIGSQASMLSLMHSTKLYDTFGGLFLQKFNFGNMYYLMFSAIFKGVSKEYYEAGYIDGASEWQVMTRIAIPLILTSFGLVFLLNFITYWNDYNTLLVYAPSHPTLGLSLFQIITASVEFQDPETKNRVRYAVLQMAACMIITVPVLVLFIIFRNKLMGNLSIGGVKE